MFIPTSKWDFIIRSVSISSYLPGRIRLHSKKLIGNAELGRKVYAYIASYKEIDKRRYQRPYGFGTDHLPAAASADQPRTRSGRKLYHDPC